MARINIYEQDTTGELVLAGWFDQDKAESHGERTRWDGNNHVGLVTGSPFIDSIMFRTAGGRWVLNTDATRINNGPDRYEFVTDAAALDWFIKAGFTAEEIESITGSQIEDERGPGRPEVGPQVVVRMSEDLRDRIDAAAAEAGLPRAAWIRNALQGALG